MYVAFLTGNDTTLLLQQGEETIPPYPITAQPVGDCHNSDKEITLYFELSVSSSGVFTYNGPYQVHKRRVLASVSLDLYMVRY